MKQGGKLNDAKDLLERRGFQTSWINPFLKWQHPELYTEKSEFIAGNILYVHNFPVQWTVPFDLAMISISIDAGMFYFKLSFYYVNLFKDQKKTPVINEIHDLHDGLWKDSVASLLSEIADSFSLKWDTKYDYYIEDILYGHLKSAEAIFEILIMLKNMYEERVLMAVCWQNWGSDLPEVESKLQKYTNCVEILSKLEDLSL